MLKIYMWQYSEALHHESNSGQGSALPAAIASVLPGSVIYVAPHWSDSSMVWNTVISMGV